MLPPSPSTVILDSHSVFLGLSLIFVNIPCYLLRFYCIILFSLYASSCSMSLLHFFCKWFLCFWRWQKLLIHSFTDMIFFCLNIVQIRHTQTAGCKHFIMTSPQPFVTSNPADDEFDYLFKVVVIGDCGVGKTCVVQRFKSGNYVERHGNTIGVDFSMKSLLVDGKRVKVSNVTFMYLLIHSCS